MGGACHECVGLHQDEVNERENRRKVKVDGSPSLEVITSIEIGVTGGDATLGRGAGGDIRALFGAGSSAHG